MKLTLLEIGSTPNSTASHLYLDDRPFCFVIEDGYREKKVMHETRIPAGTYRIVPRAAGKFFELYSKRWGHKFVPHIIDVPDFTFILIHIGNTIKDTSGCLLVNRSVGLGNDGNYFGSDSSSVYRLLYSLMEKAFERNEEVIIEIYRDQLAFGKKALFDLFNNKPAA